MKASSRCLVQLKRVTQITCQAVKPSRVIPRLTSRMLTIPRVRLIRNLQPQDPLSAQAIAAAGAELHRDKAIRIKMHVPVVDVNKPP